MATNPLTRTVRGMHFQIEEYSQRKLVTVAKGAILDVIVNLRKGSSEFGRVQTFSLSADQHNALFIPTGFAHGYQTLVPETIVCYAIDAAHSPRHSRTVSPLSPEISPLWESPLGPISENDQNAIYLEKYLDSL